MDDGVDFPYKSHARFYGCDKDEELIIRCTDRELFEVLQKAYYTHLGYPSVWFLPPKQEDDVR